MLVVVPYTRPPLTTQIPGHEVRLVDVSGSDDAYWRLFTDLWAAGGGFVVVEHDITVTAAAVDDLADCAKGWCAQPYPYIYGQMLTGLGCTKFAAEVMTAVPDLWEQVATMQDNLHSPKHWCRLDAWSNRVLDARGYSLHRHAIPVAHESPTVSHGCMPVTPT